MSAFDLKAGYHHIEVAAEQHSLLGFAYTDHSNKKRFFKFVVLPFGLATAGLIFTKVLGELMKTWRSKQIQAVCFLANGLQANQTKNVVAQHALIMKGSLLAAGWVPHKTKSQWSPVQVMDWLGFNIILIEGKIYCTHKKMAATKEIIQNILHSKITHIKHLAKLRGKIASMERSHSDLVHLMSRFTNLAIAEAPSWDCYIEILPALEKELKFWLTNIEKENGRDLFPPIAVGHIDCTLFSDASDSGCAAVLQAGPKNDKIIVNRIFSNEESLTSSTKRELLGVLDGITKFSEQLKHSNINWYTDAQNVARIVKRG